MLFCGIRFSRKFSCFFLFFNYVFPERHEDDDFSTAVTTDVKFLFSFLSIVSVANAPLLRTGKVRVGMLT